MRARFGRRADSPARVVGSARPMVDLDTRLLRAFVTVAEELNFTRAAERLVLAQQALSAQVRQVETRLGMRLFERTTRQVRLTEAGELLLPRARGPGGAGRGHAGSRGRAAGGRRGVRAPAVPGPGPLDGDGADRGALRGAARGPSAGLA
ncbi:MAG: LysR family transcriptional regulator [Solirubrobacteraceae bacterium]